MIVTITKVYTKAYDEGVEFDNGWCLQSYHDSDCCEYHWLDFDTAEEELLGKQLDLSSDFFERVPDYGIRLKVIDNYPVSVAGYGSNNGYYSSHMDLVVLDKDGTVLQLHDVSDCQEISD